MRELAALARREWQIVGRAALAGGALMALGVALLSALCQVSDRYRLLADPALLRRVALPAPLLLGAAIGYLSFASEMRQQTWDSLLLLPASRGTVLGAKLLVGGAAIAATTTAPFLALWAALCSTNATGGPVLTLAELASGSLWPRATLLGLSAFVATACASTLLRAGRAAFWLALAGPLLLLLAMNDEHRALGGAGALAAAAVSCALGVLQLRAELRETGRAPSAWLSVTRAATLVPFAAAVMVVVGAMGAEVIVQRRAREHSREDVHREPITPLRFHHDGRIVRDARGRRGLSLYAMQPRVQARSSAARVWTPELIGRNRQYFLSKHANVFLGFDQRSGRAAGCLGADGARADGCRPFDSRPVAQNNETPFVLTADGVSAYDDERFALAPLFRGRVDGFAYMGGFSSTRLALQSGEDIVLVREGEPDPSDETASEPVRRLRAEVVCRGAAVRARVRRIAVEDDFVALVTEGPAAGEETYVLCRGGRVVDRASAAIPARTPPWVSHREALAAIAIGPLGDAMLTRTHGDAEPGSAARVPRRWVFGASLVSTVVLIVALGATRRRSARGSLVALAPVALVALVMGPSLLLAFALAAWRSRGLARDASS
jgi:hypothetical protein